MILHRHIDHFNYLLLALPSAEGQMRIPFQMQGILSQMTTNDHETSNIKCLVCKKAKVSNRPSAGVKSELIGHYICKVNADWLIKEHYRNDMECFHSYYWIWDYCGHGIIRKLKTIF